MFHGGTITVQRRADMDDVDELIYGYVVFCLPIFETFAGMRFVCVTVSVCRFISCRESVSHEPVC